jgi:hypothetical protein
MIGNGTPSIHSRIPRPMVSSFYGNQRPITPHTGLWLPHNRKADCKNVSARTVGVVACFPLEDFRSRTTVQPDPLPHPCFHDLPEKLVGYAVELFHQTRQNEAMKDVSDGELAELICSDAYRPVLHYYAVGRRRGPLN